MMRPAVVQEILWQRVITAVVLCLMILLPQQQQCVGALRIPVQRVECVWEHVANEGDTVSGNFVVVDKQFDWASDKDDIEMVITGPQGQTIMSTKAKGGQKFHFKASKVGHYKICFSNPTPALEQVDFVVHVGGGGHEGTYAKGEHVKSLEATIAQLREAVEQVALEQQYYKARDLRHKRTNESTNNRLFWYTLAEYGALVGVSVGQVFLIQRLFSKRIGYNKV